MKMIDLRKYEVVKEIIDDQYTNTSNTNNACLSTDSKYILVGGNSKLFIFNQETGDVIISIKNREKKCMKIITKQGYLELLGNQEAHNLPVSMLMVDLLSGDNLTNHTHILFGLHSE